MGAPGRRDGEPDTGPEPPLVSGVVSAVEAARELGLSERTIRRAIARGHLHAVKQGRGFRIARADVIAFAREREPPSVMATSAASPPRVIGAGGPAFSLPRPLTSFFGRERELAAGERLLCQAAARLVTIMGPGGVGKTRFALRLAAHVAPEFPDGMAFISLAPVPHPELLLPTIAQGLGLREGGGLPLREGLALAIGERRMLLLLDNFEHLQRAGPVVSDLLQACPNLTVLVTSRMRLHLSGEHVVPLPPLALPPSVVASRDEIGDAEAVRLFVARAEAATDFRYSADHAPVIAAICRRLDGLPLAIELAAAWTPLLPPGALLAHLEQSLTMLTGGPADLPPRLRSLRDAIAWSFDLLTPAAQDLFARLGVFAGGFTLDAVIAVVRDGANRVEVLALLSDLANASLLRSVVDEDGAPRFDMLETIRAYAVERLTAGGRESETRDRHLAWATGLVEAIWPPRSPAPADFAALSRLDRDRNNIRAALGWAIAHGDAVSALRLASALSEYWILRGDFSEGLEWLQQALQLEGAPPHLRAASLYGVAAITENRGDLLAALGAAEASLHLAQKHGDAVDELRARFVASGPAHRLGKRTEGAVHVAEALRLAQQHGASKWLGYALIGKGYESLRRGDATRAVGWFEEAIEVFLQVGDPFGEINARYGLALVLVSRGERPRLVALHRRIILVSQSIAAPWGIMRGLDGLAAVGVAAGQAVAAARLTGAAETLSRAMGVMLNPEGAALREETVRRARGLLGSERFAAEQQAGRELGADAAITEALALADLLEGAGRVTPDVSAPRGLTARELDVLRLLADGYSNPEIAAALSISRGTVKTHVAHILAKLEAPSRAAAAAQAHRLGLAPAADSAI